MVEDQLVIAFISGVLCTLASVNVIGKMDRNRGEHEDSGEEYFYRWWFISATAGEFEVGDRANAGLIPRPDGPTG